jgi:predicted glycosyltransferase
MSPVVLVGVLDWGLGHASRVVPVVHRLTAHGATVVLASTGQALAFLRRALPGYDTVDLPQPGVRYHRVGAMPALWLRALRQPWLAACEKAWVQAFAKCRRVDAVLSDNLYGFRLAGVPSVLITHQLAPPSPWLAGVVHRRIAQWINQFDAVWIPDVEGEASLSGQLSQNDRVRIPSLHLGMYSHLQGAPAGPVRYAYTALLGGPEPQRTLLEAKVVALFSALNAPTCVVRGLPAAHPPTGPLQVGGAGIHVIPFADGHELGSIIRASGAVVARSGYSSLLDLAVLGAPAVLVPTPGQPEQLWLSRRAVERGWWHSTPQAALSEHHLAKAYTYPHAIDSHRIDEAVKALLSGTMA